MHVLVIFITFSLSGKPSTKPQKESIGNSYQFGALGFPLGGCELLPLGRCFILSQPSGQLFLVFTSHISKKFEPEPKYVYLLFMDYSHILH